MEPSENSGQFFEPKRKNRILIVASMVGAYALSFVPEVLVPIAWMSRGLAFGMLALILANWIYDGEPER